MRESGLMAVPFDPATPNMARMYDYWRGGQDNAQPAPAMRSSMIAGGTDS